MARSNKLKVKCYIETVDENGNTTAVPLESLSEKEREEFGKKLAQRMFDKITHTMMTDPEKAPDIAKRLEACAVN